MSRPDRRWRPSDADRDRYAAAISQAFAEGRIDAADMETRTARLHEASTIAELDALVEDMPPPAPASVPDAPASDRHETRRALLYATVLTIGAIVVAAIVGAVLFNTVGDEAGSAGQRPVAEAPQAPEPEEVPAPEAPPAAEELPAIDLELPSLFTEDGIVELWATAAGHGLEPRSLTLRPDRALLEVRAETQQRSLDHVEYVGGLLLGREPWSDLTGAQPDDEVFFSWSEVTPQAVLAAIDGTRAATGAEAGYVIIDRAFGDGVTIRVYPDGDSGLPYVRWDATGQQVLR